MSKRNEFISIINVFKVVAPTITEEQRIGLLRLATQQYGLSYEEAARILKDSGLVVGEIVNYFEVLELSVAELQHQTEAEIAARVDAAHDKHYRASLIAGARPGESERRTTLNKARDTLKNPQQRREHIATLQRERESTQRSYERKPSTSTTSTRGPRGYSVEQKLDAILLVTQEGYSGARAAQTLDPPASSSTVSTWVRQFTGRNRSGRPIPANQQIPAWVKEAKQLHRKKLGQGDSADNASVPSGMVLIPAGEFQMGSYDAEANSDEQPVHTVYVDAFYMDEYEVTNAQFKAFVDANPQWQKDNVPSKYHNGNYLNHWSGNSYPSGKGNHPVVFVSWYAAMAYAQWAGKRLPTEAEWEKAARGGLVGKKYPWGNVIDATKANYHSYEIGGTTPVGSYAPNGYGLYDMVGNVYEWCLDEYEEDFYAMSPRRNPVSGAASVNQIVGNFTRVKLVRVLRGGSWLLSARYVRVAGRGRDSPANLNDVIGFRCARDVNP